MNCVVNAMHPRSASQLSLRSVLLRCTAFCKRSTRVPAAAWQKPHSGLKGDERCFKSTELHVCDRQRWWLCDIDLNIRELLPPVRRKSAAASRQKPTFKPPLFALPGQISDIKKPGTESRVFLCPLPGRQEENRYLIFASL